MPKNVCHYRPKLEATFLKFVNENMTSHMTGYNGKRSGAVKYVEVPNRNVRDIMDRLEYSNPFIDIEEAGSSGQKRKAGESDEDEADRGREPDHAEEPEAKQSRVEDIASRRAELLRMFEDLCDRAGELKICMKCGKESHEGTRKDTARATESDSARGKMTMLFRLEGHPSSDEDIEMEVPHDEEMAPMSSEPHEKPHQPEAEEPIFYPKKEFHKYNYVVNLSEMADLAEGGELHVGQLDLHTNPNGTMKEYNHMLDSFGGASPSVIPQPGDEAVCEGIQGYSCVTRMLPGGSLGMQNRDTSFPYWPYSEYTAFGSHIHHQDLFFTSTALLKILRHQIGQKRGHSSPLGGWVNIDHILSREGAFLQDRCKKSDKFQIIAACIRSEVRKARKPRLQILAAKFDQEIDMETMTGLIAAGWSKNMVEHGGWWQPWCIRASFGFARPAELCNILFLNMSDRSGGAFHVTKPSALEGIILRGVVPGSNDGARRLAVHFGVFAPWDSENILTKTAMHDIKEGDDLIAIYVPTRMLSPIRGHIGRDDRRLRDHSLQREKGNLEIARAPSRARSVQDSRTLWA